MAVTFASGSAELTGDTPTTLEAVGRALTAPALQDMRFLVEGHTDTVGSAQDNQKLSQARAEAVARYLESTYGIDAERLEAVGVGKTRLLYPTPDQTPEERNRRVVVVKLSS